MKEWQRLPSQTFTGQQPLRIESDRKHLLASKHLQRQHLPQFFPSCFAVLLSSRTEYRRLTPRAERTRKKHWSVSFNMVSLKTLKHANMGWRAWTRANEKGQLLSPRVDKVQRFNVTSFSVQPGRVMKKTMFFEGGNSLKKTMFLFPTLQSGRFNWKREVEVQAGQVTLKKRRAKNSRFFCQIFSRFSRVARPPDTRNSI